MNRFLRASEPVLGAAKHKVHSMDFDDSRQNNASRLRSEGWGGFGGKIVAIEMSSIKVIISGYSDLIETFWPQTHFSGHDEILINWDEDEVLCLPAKHYASYLKQAFPEIQ